MQGGSGDFGKVFVEIVDDYRHPVGNAEDGVPYILKKSARTGPVRADVRYFSRFFILYTLTANVEPLCRNADTGGGRMPSMPSTIRAELKPMMKR